MKPRFRRFVVAAFALALSTPAFAQEEPKPDAPDKPDAPEAPARPERTGPTAEQMMERLDLDGDGFIDAEEAAARGGRGGERGREGRGRRGGRGGMMGDLIAEADKDGDGKVSLEELRGLLAKDPTDRAFDRIDKNKDGKLDAEEIAATPRPERTQEMDADGDGAITREEFKESWEKRQAERGRRGERGQRGRRGGPDAPKPDGQKPDGEKPSGDQPI